jgi:hypothetical protein
MQSRTVIGIALTILAATGSGSTGHFTSNVVGAPFTTAAYFSDYSLKIDDSVCHQVRGGTDYTYDPINFGRLRVTSLQPCAVVPIFNDGFEGK